MVCYYGLSNSGKANRDRFVHGIKKSKYHTVILQKPKIGAHSICKNDFSQILYELIVTFLAIPFILICKLSIRLVPFGSRLQ